MIILTVSINSLPNIPIRKNKIKCNQNVYTDLPINLYFSDSQEFLFRFLIFDCRLLFFYFHRKNIFRWNVKDILFLVLLHVKNIIMWYVFNLIRIYYNWTCRFNKDLLYNWTWYGTKWKHHGRMDEQTNIHTFYFFNI